MDGIISGAYIFMALAVLENVTSHVLRTRHMGKQALRLDRLSRWLFPIAYLTSWIVMTLVFM